ncbi:MAG: hypothetical protein GY861_25095 [bacterium]|nr:hypothetical protein [bacterium]
MKAYAIKCHDGEYVKFVKGYLKLHYRTSEIKYARHYKKAGSAKGIIARELSNCNNGIEHSNRTKDNFIKHNQPTAWIDKNITRLRQKQLDLTQWTVEEVDLEAPNFAGKSGNQEIVFKTHGIGVTTKKSQGNMYCKGCGVYFKDIPLVQFGKSSKPARICPLCILERAKDAEKLLEEMSQERREEFEAERFATRI